MSLTLRKKTLHQNFKVMSLQYVKKSNNYLSQPLKYRQVVFKYYVFLHI